MRSILNILKYIRQMLYFKIQDMLYEYYYKSSVDNIARGYYEYVVVEAVNY